MFYCASTYCILKAKIRGIPFCISPKTKPDGRVYYYVDQPGDEGRDQKYIRRANEDKILYKYELKKRYKELLRKLEEWVARMPLAVKRNFYQEVKLYDESMMREWPDDKSVAGDGTAMDSKEELIAYETAGSFGMELRAHESLGAFVPDFTWEQDGGFRHIWEHMGLNNKPDYHDKQVRKVRYYASLGMKVGKNFIITAAHNGNIRVPEILWRLVEHGQITARRVRRRYHKKK